MLVGLSGKSPSTLEELLGRDLAARLDRLDLLSRKMLAGKLPGERRSKRRGRSVEFDDFRDYIPGDDLRHLDWHVLARLDRLVIKLFREDEDLALHLLVDASPSMNAGQPGKMAFSHALAMALAYIGVVNQNRVSVATFGGLGAGPGGLRQLAPVRGRPGVRRIAEFLLESLRTSGEGGATPAPDSMNRAMRSLAQTRAGKGIVVVLSDLLTPAGAPSGYLPGLNALAVGEGGGYDTSVVQVLSPGELDPRAERERGLVGDLRLTDVETLRGAEVTLSTALIARYRARIDAYIEDARRACRARGIAHYLVTSDTRIDQLVIGALRRGGMLR
jgi:hypothetical protein